MPSAWLSLSKISGKNLKQNFYILGTSTRAHAERTSQENERQISGCEQRGCGQEC